MVATRSLFDLPNAPRPDGETSVPVRFMPDFDNILLGHADRSRIMPPGRHVGLFSSNGTMQGAVLVDGFVRAKWVPVKTKGVSTLAVTPFEKPIVKPDQPAIVREGLRLLDFLAPDEKHDVRFEPVKR